MPDSSSDGAIPCSARPGDICMPHQRHLFLWNNSTLCLDMDMQVGRGFSSRQATKPHGEFVSISRRSIFSWKKFVWLAVSEID